MAWGSVSEALAPNGAETAAQLYAPYGTTRYAAGSMPTAKGFTGQRADVTTGLDYYGARYYDAQAGQFAAADSKADGLSPYAYVAGNPETMADPSGHLACAATHCAATATSGFCYSSGCKIDRQIAQEFRDPRVQVYLDLLATTPTGLAALQYLLFLGTKVPDLISFSDLGPITSCGSGCETGEPAASSKGRIYLNINAAGVIPDIVMAAGIVHETVESYFEIKYGSDIGTINADYTADWFAGKFLNEASVTRSPLNPNASASETEYNSSLQGYGFGSYYASSGNPGFSGWGKNAPQWYQPSGYHGEPITGTNGNWPPGWATNPLNVGKNLPNPLGLQPWMLTALNCNDVGGC